MNALVQVQVAAVENDHVRAAAFAARQHSSSSRLAILCSVWTVRSSPPRAWTVSESDGGPTTHELSFTSLSLALGSLVRGKMYMYDSMWGGVPW